MVGVNGCGVKGGGWGVLGVCGWLWEGVGGLCFEIGRGGSIVVGGLWEKG